MRFYVDTLTDEEKAKAKAEGKFVYDLRGYDDYSEGESFFATIEPSVWANNVGNIVTSEKLDFVQSDYIDYEEWANDNEEVESIEEV